ncbi:MULTISPECIES: sulfur carrier protein ThiS [Bacillus]|uniref:Thiamine biosynthesis protein ThiS n=2 Tax=Bacillus TaxID=1386 RepID=A0A0M4FET9_9BACI|nr:MULTISPECIES: sulfur carrier protein ThiS [Bacillus]ALC80761.1 thiamine biosynthesis protein ThiS [Bacillus gobiensis]MBP1079663.1 sulfur carrier protein [Bacillus capparidis]MED1095064.1 sulfur carrier protein ThiS [Bacillus capparidis]
MMIQLNGRKITVDNGITTVQKLLEAYQLDNRIVIVEKNKEIIDKSNYTDEQLQENDVVELVHFVGGG